MRKIMISAIWVAMVITGCSKTNPGPADGPVPLNISEKSKQIISADNRFGFELFNKILKTDSSENLMISPFSVSTALSMTLNGADGQTLEDMKQVLHFNDLVSDDFNASMKELIHAILSVDPEVIMNIANSIWYRQDFFVEPAFLEINRKTYDAEVNALDFNNPASKDIINGWVADQTNNKITEIVDRINPLDVMFLINAIYFKGTWKYRFDEDNTQTLPFHISPSATVNVPTMIRKGDFAWFHNNILTAAELDYGRGNFSMVILLPNQGYELSDISDALTAENWNNWMNGFDTLYDAKIFLPRFTFSYDKPLKETLSDLGLGIAFNPDSADFSRINPDKQLYISSVKHKTFIEVNEEGTEAAAVTSVTVGTTSVGPETAIIIDKPFIFVIREKTTGVILFMGKVAHPALEE
ncbi:MAG: serpin family protein [Chlorobi bacterium]|nr:serpin family protein [Chlorobiota bacterium]